MKREYYVLFSCDEWKSTSSMEFIGVFCEGKLRKILKKKIKKNEFELELDIEQLDKGDIYTIDNCLTYGYIKKIYLNEEE